MDLISRQAAIELLNSRVGDLTGTGTFFEKLLNELPSVEAVPKWIPVTERLPEEQGRYLVDAVGFEPNSVSVATYGIPYAIEPEDEKLCFYYSEEFDYPIEVSAWMPLPEPYEGEKL